MDFEAYLIEQKFSEIIDYANDILEKNPNDAEAMYWKLIATRNQKGNNNQEFLELGLGYLERISDEEYLVKIRHEIGITYITLGMYNDAIATFQENVALAKEMDDKDFYGRGVNNLGGIYFFRGDYNSALELFSQALLFHSDIDDFVLHVRHNIALVQEKMGDPDIAIRELEEVLDGYYEVNQSISALVLIRDLFLILVKYENYTKADIYIRKFESIIENEKLERFNPQKELLTAIMYLESPQLKDIAKAEDILEKSIESDKLSQEMRFIALKYLIKYRLIEFSLRQNEYTLGQIEKLIQILISDADKHKVYPYLVDTYLLKIKIEEIRGNYDKIMQNFDIIERILTQEQLTHLQNKVDRAKLKVEENLNKMKKIIELGSSFIERMSILEMKSYLDLIKHMG